MGPCPPLPLLLAIGNDLLTADDPIEISMYTGRNRPGSGDKEEKYQLSLLVAADIIINSKLQNKVSRTANAESCTSCILIELPTVKAAECVLKLQSYFLYKYPSVSGNR